MKPIADHFKISVEEAAMGVIRLADANMINALKLVSVRRGYDPRDFVLIAFGGGGAMHAGALARELRVKKVLIPNEPAVFSAWGMLMTDLRQDFIRTFIRRADQIATGDAHRHLSRRWRPRRGQNLRDSTCTDERIMFQRFADMRYLGQEHTVKVPIPGGEITAEQMPRSANGSTSCTSTPTPSGSTR